MYEQHDSAAQEQGNHDAACAHLRQTDERWDALIRTAGACPLTRRRGYFRSLCKAILAQQLAVPAAATITARFERLFPRRRPTPAHLASLSDSSLRSVGLSGQKVRYVRNLAEHFQEGSIPVRCLPRMSDEEIIDALTQVKGVGEWTAQMFLIFVLSRPDVWPVDDLGIQKAVARSFIQRGKPSARRLERIAAPWRPYRSIAAWYLWRSLDNAPLQA